MILILLSAAQHRSYRQGRERLLDVAAANGVSEGRGELLANLRREPDLEWGKLLLSRYLLVEAATDSRRPVARRLEGLRQSRDLAAEILIRRPAAWQGHMIAGATLYLEWSLTRDPRLIRDWRRWEAPLETALTLAPNESEPKTFLVTAYLEIWPFLSADKQQLARNLLREVFQDPASAKFDTGLLRAWLEVAGSEEEALELLPDTAHVWNSAQRIFSASRRWRPYVEVRRRGQRAELRQLEGNLQEAASRIRGGDVLGARRLLWDLIRRLRPDRRHVPLLIQALTQLPPGPLTGSARREWLEWSVERCLWDDCMLLPRIVERLANTREDLPPLLAAQVALAAHDLRAAEQYERRFGLLWSATWAPYLIAKSRYLAEGNDGTAARRALEQVHRRWHGKPVYLEQRLDLAVRGQDPAEISQARAAVEEAGRRRWLATDWRGAGSVNRLEMLTAARASGIRVFLDQVPTTGGVIELRWNGGAVASFPLSSKTRRVLLEQESSPGPHLLELESIAGGNVVPGVVELWSEAEDEWLGLDNKRRRR